MGVNPMTKCNKCSKELTDDMFSGMSLNNIHYECTCGHYNSIEKLTEGN